MDKAHRQFLANQIFTQGVIFEAAAVLIEKGLHKNAKPMYVNLSKKNNSFLAIPIVVQNAITAEIMLKALRVLEMDDNGKVPEGHNLWSLYSNLSLDSKSDIEEHYAQLKSIEPHPLQEPTVKSLLKKSSNYFQKYRYIYETPPLAGERSAVGIEDFITAMKRRILDVVPAWKPMVKFTQPFEL